MTSGDWGRRTGLNIAYAFVDPPLADLGTALEIDVLGTMIAAQVISPSPYDPPLSRVRG